jgi:hypothetical protein
VDTRRRRTAGIPALIALAGAVAGGGTLLLALAIVPTDVTPPAAGGPPSGSSPGPVQAHRDGSFALWGDDHRGAPLRWDACATVAFALSTAAAPEHAERDLVAALAGLAEASGLDLRLTGTTDERPTRSRPLVELDGETWRWRPVLVAWASPGETDIPLTAADRGVALPVAVRDGDREAFVTGQVVINAQRRDLVAGFGDRSDAVGATLLHEIGHVLGLAHVDDTTQLMSEDPGSGPVVLGVGDRAGLRAIGAAAGCSPAPSPEVGRGLVADR